MTGLDGFEAVLPPCVYGRATSWAELKAAHARFFQNYNHQAHAAHEDRPKGRLSPAAVLGWVQGAWCDLTDVDRLFRLRTLRHITASGSIRFRHWRLYAERGLAGERAAVWVSGETLTLAYETATLAQYGVALEAKGRGLKAVTEPRFFATDHGSPQPFLPMVEDVEWEPAQRLSPYRDRRLRGTAARQERLFELPVDDRAAASAR